MRNFVKLYWRTRVKTTSFQSAAVTKESASLPPTTDDLAGKFVLTMPEKITLNVFTLTHRTSSSRGNLSKLLA